MGSPQDGGGGKAATGAKVKRCPHCGAKNKESFEYCVRCTESLDAIATWSVAGSSRSPVAMLVVVALLLTVALAVVALIASVATEEAPTSSASSAAASTPVKPKPVTDPILEDVDAYESAKEFTEAIAAFRSEDYVRARDLFEALASSLPGNARALQFLGLSYFHTSDFVRAKETFAEALELRPDSFDLLDQYVTACKSDGDNDGAFNALRDYVDRSPDELDARLELARIARLTGNEDVAMEQTEFLATTRDADPEFVYEYGVSLKDAGQLDEAKAVLRNSIELDPASGQALHALGVTELISGNPAAAVASLEKAVAVAPDNSDYQFSLAQTYEELERIPESLAAYEAYVKNAAPDDARAEVVRQQLELAKKALAEEQKRTE